MKRGSRCVPPPHRVLWREPFVALVSPKHRFCREGKSSISLADLDGEPIVLRGSCEMPRGRLWPDHVRTEDCRSHRSRRDGAEAGGVRVGSCGRAEEPGDERRRGSYDFRDLKTTRSIGLKWRPELRDDALRSLLTSVGTRCRRLSLVRPVPFDPRRPIVPAMC